MRVERELKELEDAARGLAREGDGVRLLRRSASKDKHNWRVVGVETVTLSDE